MQGEVVVPRWKGDCQAPKPFAVGGVGGSGTRVVARILQCLGCYLGSSLNESLDNLWFTLLLKEPQRLVAEDATPALALFERAMVTGLEALELANCKGIKTVVMLGGWPWLADNASDDDIDSWIDTVDTKIADMIDLAGKHGYATDWTGDLPPSTKTVRKLPARPRTGTVS